MHMDKMPVCLIIGAYSKWLDAAPSGFSKLPSVIDILMTGMRASEDSAATAALAFGDICDDCCKKLCAYCKQLFHIYCTAINGEGSFKGSAEDLLHLVEALSMVITELPPEPAKGALEELCSSVVTPLQLCKSSQSSCGCNSQALANIQSHIGSLCLGHADHEISLPCLQICRENFWKFYGSHSRSNA